MKTVLRGFALAFLVLVQAAACNDEAGQAEAPVAAGDVLFNQ